MSLVLAIDQGTTSSRAVAFNTGARPVASAQEEFAQHFPQPGWVEHAPQDLWETVVRVATRAARQARRHGRIRAVGITNQRETTLLWDRRTGEPLAPAIVWQDRRTASACQALRRSGVAQRVRTRSGLELDPYFSATKLAWLLDRLPGARRRAVRGELAFGTVDTWLLWKLTQGRVHATDVSNASRTLLVNLRTGDWDDTLLALFRIPREVLPEIRPSSGLFGEISALPALRGLPITGIAGDQQAALFGQACFTPGMAKSTYGTGCFLLLHTGTQPVRSRHRLLSTIAWRIGDDGPLEYALEGSVFIGGAVVQWLRDGLGVIRHSRDVEALAARVPDSGGVRFVPAFTGLGAPYWDPEARGAIVGLERGSTAAHVARAALESIAFQVSDLLTAMRADTGLRLRELRVDGGAARNDALLQFQSDLLRVPVTRSRVTETTALGAAFLAGLAVGVWKDRAALRRLWAADAHFAPEMPLAHVRQELSAWADAVRRTRTPRRTSAGT
jgi:glycerol kinase